MRLPITAILAVAALAAAAGRVSADDADVLRQAQDRAEIQALMWRYVRALDSLDADAYAATYTENGSFGSASAAEHGRAEMRKMIEGLKARRTAESPPMYHVITNSYIEFTGKDSARYHSYWMTMFGPAGEGSAPRVAAVGRGIDELRRIDGHWLIESRNVAPDN